MSFTAMLIQFNCPRMCLEVCVSRELNKIYLKSCCTVKSVCLDAEMF